MILRNVDFKLSTWLHDGEEVKHHYSQSGVAVYSESHALIVAMEYLPNGHLDAKVLCLNGYLVTSITPSEEDISYQYIVAHPLSSSGIAVVASYSELVDHFQDWHFEINLNNFSIGKRLTPAY
ncbi:hypothetical protein [Vibrio nigripulchritudo]|uniref:hypothetical protein n=1 Tax=Vibrio nigripulchritudo TaxID=28173 RepID=UPI0003B1D2EC|nr:hypothetical protein [Vibrio nigripulchritudo]CCN73311.1 hypothetical protein VIBNISFn118_800009 [Vibrio nigripulchritudo SFn118]